VQLAFPRYLLTGSARPNYRLYAENENAITADDQEVVQLFTAPFCTGFPIDERVWV
jgi:hypothetical protein